MIVIPMSWNGEAIGIGMGLWRTSSYSHLNKACQSLRMSWEVGWRGKLGYLGGGIARVSGTKVVP